MEENVKQYLAYKKGEIRMPSHLKPRKELKGHLFKNPILESLSRTTIAPPILMHLGINSFLFWYAISKLEIAIGLAVLLLFLGMLFWTLAEYVVHRFLYHTESNSKSLFKIQHSGHGIHHQHPLDPTRFAMPPLPGLLASGLFLLIFWLIMSQFAFAFFPGFMLGYMIYISIHYMQHKHVDPKLPSLRALWNHHAQHHHRDPYSAYGVSTRLWDLVFGTMPQKKSKRRT